jgi:hypothetical protein
VISNEGAQSFPQILVVKAAFIGFTASSARPNE